jgi:hypothetical protein
MRDIAREINKFLKNLTIKLDYNKESRFYKN